MRRCSKARSWISGHPWASMATLKGKDLGCQSMRMSLSPGPKDFKQFKQTACWHLYELQLGIRLEGSSVLRQSAKVVGAEKSEAFRYFEEANFARHCGL